MTLTFTILLREIKATYQTERHTFHVMATRYYLGAETRASLWASSRPGISSPGRTLPPVLTPTEVEIIIRNR